MNDGGFFFRSMFSLDGLAAWIPIQCEAVGWVIAYTLYNLGPIHLTMVLVDSDGVDIFEVCRCSAFIKLIQS